MDENRCLTICPLCSKCMKDPRILLPCSHTFCFDCLNQRIERNGPLCPSCGNNFEIPGGKFENLKKNDFILKLLIHTMLCEICAKDPVANLCEECHQYYCQNCSIQHLKFASTKNHVLHDVNDPNKIILETNEYLLCQTHFKEINMYCERCSHFVCITCFVNDHNGHKMKLISDQFNCIKRSLEGHLVHKREKLEKLNEELNKIQPLLDWSNDKAKEIQESIRNRSEELKRVIDKHEKELSEKVCIDVGAYKRRANNVEEQIKRIIGRVEDEIGNYEATSNGLNFKNVANTPIVEDFEYIEIPSFEESFVLTFESTRNEDVFHITNSIGEVVNEADIFEDVQPFH